MRLLQTKLNKPPILNTYIERENINRLLESYNRFKLVLVSAPAGSGKSTVMDAWFDALNIPYVWYSLDASDNDPYQFIAYLISGLKQQEALKTYDLSTLLDTFQSLGPDGMIRSIIAVLYEAEIDLMILLDDYHLIRNHEIHEMMSLFIEHLPQQVHLVVVTREDPPLSLSKLRVRQQLLEIRVKALQFSDSEATAFMKETMGLDMDQGLIDTLNQKIEGWVAGLQLAGLTLKSSQDMPSLIQEFSGNHYIMDYLMEEVLNHLDSDTVNFLLATSILSQFSGKLCDDLLELPAGGGMNQLLKLSQSNSFLIPLDHQRQWYRYHHLFKDLLVERLSLTDMDIKNLHQRASHWFMADGNIDLAIYHGIESGNMDQAAMLIENCWAEMDRSLQAKHWLDLFNKLPIPTVEKRPVLMMGYAWALVDTGNHQGAELWLERSQSLYDAIEAGEISDYQVSDREQYDLLPSTIASAYCYIALGLGQFDRMFEYADKAFNHKSKMTPHRSGVLRMMLGLAYWAIGDLPKARTEIASAIEDLKRYETILDVAAYQVVIIELLMDTGLFDSAAEQLDQIITTTLSSKKIPLVLANLYLLYSRIHLSKGDLDQAIKTHQQAKSHGMKYHLPDFWYKWYQQQATIQIHQGLFTSALFSLDEADACYYLNPLITRTSIKGLRGYIYLLLGRLSDAALCFKDLYAEQDLIYQAIYLAKIGEIDKASHLLSSMYDTTVSQGREKSTVDVVLGQAVLASISGQKDAILPLLEQTITFINAHHYIEPFLNYKDILGPYYNQLALTHGILEKLTIESTHDHYSVFEVNQKLPEPLTVRELEIIQLLAEGYSNQDICNQLFLALSTVKGYNQNLYDKLGVRRRTEAVAKARLLKLI